MKNLIQIPPSFCYSLLLGPNIHRITINVCANFKIRDQVSHPYMHVGCTNNTHIDLQTTFIRFPAVGKQTDYVGDSKRCAVGRSYLFYAISICKILITSYNKYLCIRVQVGKHRYYFYSKTENRQAAPCVGDCPPDTVGG